jgi:hypothetical protein
MTIQEAIKSGKPFRRKRIINIIDWGTMIDNGEIISLKDGMELFYGKNDILADDWEVKQ